MPFSSDNSSEKKLVNPISISLEKYQSKILEDWVKAIKNEIESAANLRAPIIVNTIPVFLGNLSEAIDGKLTRETANDSNNVAEAHGGERARVTDYSPDQVIKEYILLRDLVLEKLGEHHVIDGKTNLIIQRSFDEAIQKAMMAFYLVYNEIRENVVNHLTHDLRTPLTSAKLSIDLIIRHMSKTPVDTAKVVVLANKAKKSLDYSNELIQNILDDRYLKSVPKNDDEKFLPSEMTEILHSAISGFSDDAISMIKLSGEPVYGFWEKKSIRRLAENIISNALKYGDEKGLIEIKVAATLGRIMVSFHNKGPPIPENELGLLFNNFQRTTSSEKGELRGWGLGLSYCRKVAKDHAGSLGVESRPETGTTFIMDIPVDPRGIPRK
jgi:signal transduction histidine kinase